MYAVCNTVLQTVNNSVVTCQNWLTSAAVQRSPCWPGKPGATGYCYCIIIVLYCIVLYCILLYYIAMCKGPDGVAIYQLMFLSSETILSGASQLRLHCRVLFGVLMPDGETLLTH